MDDFLIPKNTPRAHDHILNVLQYFKPRSKVRKFLLRSLGKFYVSPNIFILIKIIFGFLWVSFPILFSQFQLFFNWGHIVLPLVVSSSWIWLWLLITLSFRISDDVNNRNRIEASWERKNILSFVSWIIKWSLILWLVVRIYIFFGHFRSIYYNQIQYSDTGKIIKGTFLFKLIIYMLFTDKGTSKNIEPKFQFEETVIVRIFNDVKAAAIPLMILSLLRIWSVVLLKKKHFFWKLLTVLSVIFYCVLVIFYTPVREQYSEFDDLIENSVECFLSVVLFFSLIVIEIKWSIKEIFKKSEIVYGLRSIDRKGNWIKLCFRCKTILSLIGGMTCCFYLYFNVFFGVLSVLVVYYSKISLFACLAWLVWSKSIKMGDLFIKLIYEPICLEYCPARWKSKFYILVNKKHKLTQFKKTKINMAEKSSDKRLFIE